MLSIVLPKMKTTNIFKISDIAEEKKGFLELITPVKKQLYNYILKSLSFSEDAEDVFQEVIIRGYKYFSKYDQDRLFSVWIFSISHNEIKRYFKQKKRKPTENIEGKSLPIDSEEGNEQKKVANIYRIAEELKPKHKEVFFLFYNNGFTIKEISGICNIKEGNIKFILNKARNRIKDLLGEKNG